MAIKTSQIQLFLVMFTFMACSEFKKEAQQEDKQLLIAYNVLVDAESDNYDIFTMNLDGSNKHNITNDKDVAWTYISHKQKIFFISDRDTTSRKYFLYEMDYAGKNIRKLTDFLLRDSWMGTRNNGKELIVFPQTNEDSLFRIIETDGQLIKRFNPGTAYFSHPTFSPDGTQIAFVGKNKPSKREEGYQEEIYVVDDVGENLLRLTYYPDDDTTANWYDYRAGPPIWHPTENFISYQSKQNGKYSLYGVSPDGSKHWKLTSNVENEGWHSWSPDGKWLAIELFDNEQTQFHIGLMNWESKEMRILTDIIHLSAGACVRV